MIGDGSFLVEEFINAITSQLDRVQDALRIKAVNRPLTYALKDFSLDLHVFVELDPQGNVRFRPSGPNETGSSTVRLGFTTITKPMIEENTISLAMTRSPTLSEVGLAPEEQQRLEQFGVRNVAQLRRLGASAGASTIARLAGVPLERLRRAVQAGSPRVTTIGPDRPPAAQPTSPPQAPPRTEATTPPQRPPRVEPVVPRAPRPETIPPPEVSPRRPPRLDDMRVGPDDLSGRFGERDSPLRRNRDLIDPARTAPAPARTAPVQAPTPDAPPDSFLVTPPVKQGVEAPPLLRLPPDARRLRLAGQNLMGENGPPLVRLNDQILSLAAADDDELLVDLPARPEGTLEVELPDGGLLSYQVRVEDASGDDAAWWQEAGSLDDAADPWAPEEG